MSITERIMSLDASLVPIKEGADTSFNHAGVGVSTGELLYALVRILKPITLLETGTNVGISASYIAMGLMDNHKNDGIIGKLITIERLDSVAKEAQERFNKLNLSRYIDLRIASVEDVLSDNELGFVLLDSEPKTRLAEFLQFYDEILPGAIIVIHDMCSGIGMDAEWGLFPPKMADAIYNHELRRFHFETPRGITLFQKQFDDKDDVILPKQPFWKNVFRRNIH